MKFYKYLLISLLQLLQLIAIENPEDFVNLLSGTFSDGHRFSTGNTLPLVGLPHAFNHWAPQSIDENINSGSWWFKGSEHVLTWLRCTHQTSPWIGDWGYFVFAPQLGDVNRNPVSFWEPRGATIKPYLFDATVAPHNIRMELAPTMHGAYFRVTFPIDNRSEKRICFASANWVGEGIVPGQSPIHYIEGQATQVHHDRMLITNFAVHIRAESNEAESIERHQDMICFKYKRDTNIATVRMATSLISSSQAAVNLGREVPATTSFEAVRDNARSVWHKLVYYPFTHFNYMLT